MLQLQTQVNAALPGRSSVIVHSSDDGQRHVVASSSPAQPIRFYIFDKAHARMVKFAETYPNLPADTLSEPQAISFSSRDGLTLQGYLTVPKNRAHRAWPLVVFPHGGPWARDAPSFNLWTQAFASRGWAVLQINFRGSTGYGEAFERAGFRQWGLEMQDDITDGVRWAVNRFCRFLVSVSLAPAMVAMRP